MPYDIIVIVVEDGCGLWEERPCLSSLLVLVVALHCRPHVGGRV